MTITGTLEGGMMGIGGEHTGWQLRPDDGSAPVELDPGDLRDEARKLDGRKVRVTGHMRDKDYLERGRTPILHITRLTAE